MSTFNPDLPAENVTIDRSVLFGILDDMADAAIALETAAAEARNAGDNTASAERTRSRDALRLGISELWTEANLHQLHPDNEPPGP